MGFRQASCQSNGVGGWWRAERSERAPARETGAPLLTVLRRHPPMINAAFVLLPPSFRRQVPAHPSHPQRLSRAMTCDP
eukprot:scaffold2340_cov113-Isochrysis_galbana.AAC.11